MRFFSRKERDPINVAINVRAFVEGRLLRLSLSLAASEGDRLKDLLKQLGSDGTLEPGIVRYILRGSPGLTVLHNGRRLAMPEARNAPLADGDELSILTPMAGG